MLDVGVQNLHTNDRQINMDLKCNEAHSLFSSADGWTMVQDKEKRAQGVRGFLSLFHVYIDTCASYASMPYPQLLRHLMTQAQGLIGYSNVGLCGMS